MGLVVNLKVTGMQLVAAFCCFYEALAGFFWVLSNRDFIVLLRFL